jgi:uncharacterized protein YbjT (DUF2867 family)
MYAITGVTGHTGSVVAETLLAQGKQIRVVVRDAAKGEAWRAKGADVAVATLADTAALTRALSGVAGAYVLLPPNVTSTDPLGDNAKVTASIAAAVRASGVPHVVLLSSIGAQHADGTGPIRTLHLAERELAATGAALTAVRAAYFQENWGASLGTLDTGTVYAFLPTGLRFPQVATVDIGRTAAAALVEGAPKGARQIIELAGPSEVSGDDVGRALTAITGKSIAVQAAPLDGVVPAFTSFGLSTAMAELYREMYEGIISGRVGWQGGSARSVRGRASIEDTLKKLLGRA